MAKNKNHHMIKRGNIWYLKKVVNGRLIKKPLSQSVTEARQLRDQYLKEILIHGNIPTTIKVNDSEKLFGELAQVWIKIKKKEIKSSTLRDYRVSMNYYILPEFGNRCIEDISYLDIKKFIALLTCSAKRINNVLVPMRSLFNFALLSGYIEKDPMQLIKNLKVEKPDIYPLSMEDVNRFLDRVTPRYRNFFIVAFFTGMRFGEMAALKWKNVDFKMGIIRVRVTRVMGEEGRPKTKRSIRDIKMLPPVVEALRDQRKDTMGRSDYVFLNQ